MSHSRMIVLLLVMFCVLCLAVVYAWVAMPKLSRIAPGQSPVRQTDGQQQKITAASFPEKVADLDFSGGGDNKYQKPEKNLFDPLYLPPKVVKPRHVPPPPPKVTKRIAKRIAKPRKVVPVVIPPQGPKPIQPLSVLGYLNKSGEYTVFLSSKQGDLFLVKAGDTFAEDLLVRSVSAKEVIIARRQTDQQVVLRLGEAKSQRLPDVKFQSDRPEFKPQQQSDSVKPKPEKSSGMSNEGVEK